jgi:hypothetical protein
MKAVISLTSLSSALAELELAASIVLLAEQEQEPLLEGLDRLRRRAYRDGRTAPGQPRSWSSHQET